MQVSWVITAGKLSPGEGTGAPADDEWMCGSPIPLSPNSSSSSWSRTHRTQGSDEHGFTANTENMDLR